MRGMILAMILNRSTIATILRAFTVTQSAFVDCSYGENIIAHNGHILIGKDITYVISFDVTTKG